MFEKYPILHIFRKKNLLCKLTRIIYGFEIGRTIFIYKNAIIYTPVSHYTGIYFEKNFQENAETLIDLLSFLEYKILYFSSNNIEFDKIIRTYYEGINQDFTLSNNCNDTKNFYKFDKYNIIEFQNINHPILFALYHTALKQPEPLARCVFLFRIIEYAFNYLDYEKKYFKNGKKNYPDYINNLYIEAIKYNLIPLYYSKYTNAFEYKNIIPEWKNKVKIYYRKLENNNISLGEQIYKFGRCGIAHGGDINKIIFHDYGKQYKEIISINFVLEIICRYIIEKENLKLRNKICFKQKN